MDGWRDGQTGEQMVGWTEGQTDRRTYGQTDRWMDGWVISLDYIYISGTKRHIER